MKANIKLNLVTNPPSPSEKLVRDFIRYIEANLGDANMTVAQICKKLHVSEATLNRRVKEYTGRSSGRYILHVRMQVAQSLLQSTSLNISEIAYQVGYRNPNTFSRFFKKEVGVSPSDFRRENGRRK